MSEIMRPIKFDKLIKWMFNEYNDSKSIFGIREDKFYKNDSGTNIKLFGSTISSPIGPAAGPNSQLTQNIIASYLAGARFIELKTVQTMDGEELRNCVARPCINAQDEGYNVEWSTELYVHEAMEEYIKAWIAIHVINKELGLSDKTDFIFNLSVGYDLEGIKSEKIDSFLEGLKDGSTTKIWNECREYLLNNLDEFKNIDEEFINSIPSSISPSATLSTLHGCPPEEIERIARYLLTEKNMHTYIKCNPTLLGYDFARKTLDDLGYNYIHFDDHHFKEDLQYKDAIPMFKRLIQLSKENERQFGVKITNTFPVDIKRKELPGEEMYMSGRSLYPLSINLASKLTSEFEGKLPISYSGGADYFNIKDLITTGIQPVTVATTILKPGGYERLNQLALEAEPHLKGEFKGINVSELKEVANSALDNKYNLKQRREVKSRKTDSILSLYDCYKAPCKDGGCPIEQQIPEYLRLISEEKYDEAFKIIAIDNAAPGITGTICDHQCQHKCTRLDYDTPLKIRQAKLIASNNAQNEFISNLDIVNNKTDKKVAVIGAGVAGVSTALFLKRNGVGVTVFEKREKPFGIVEYIIPEFRIASDVIQKDFELAKSIGVEFVFGVKEDYDINELKKEFDYIVIATGAWKNGFKPFEDGSEKVLDAFDFLEESKKKNLQLNLGKNVLVVGGGDVSMDCSRAAKRTPGVENVYLSYRKTKEFMPASYEEVSLAKGDGVEFLYLVSPISFDGENITLQKNTMIGNNLVATKDKEILKVDTVISAIGCKVDTTHYEKNNISLNEWNLPIINEHNETTVKDVYVAGDGKAGSKTVVKAIADGKKIAADILNKLDLENDFIKISIPQEREMLINKKGILCDSLNDFSDGNRCLTCDKVCDICVDVCPNRANIAIKVDGFKQDYQILHVDGMCNECGNCAVFCPHTGRPYIDKVTLFWSKEDLIQSENVGFFKSDDNTFIVRDEQGEIIEYKDGLDNISASMKSIIHAVVNDYGYFI